MVRDDLSEIKDQEYNKIITPVYNDIYKYIRMNILSEYIGYYITRCYNGNALWRQSLDLIINSALNDLAQLEVEHCNKTEIKKILETEYKLKITNENPLQIKEII